MVINSDYEEGIVQSAFDLPIENEAKMSSRLLRDHEIDCVSTELDQVKCEMSSLKNKRARLRSRLNQLRAPTSSLPPETLSLIFQYACQLPDAIGDGDPHLPIILGGVSTHWREVAWSTSLLWTALAIEARHAQYASASTLSLLRLYLDNIGHRLLSLRILIPEEAEDGDDDTEWGQDDIGISEVVGLLFQNRTKIRKLFCDFMWPRWWDGIASHFNKTGSLGTAVFPNLEYIHLGVEDTPDLSWPTEDHGLKIQLAPRLTCVSLIRNAPPLPIPLGQLTRLILECLPIDQCMTLLKDCPNLTDYYCRKPGFPAELVPFLDEPLVLKHMKCFGWTFGDHDWDQLLLTRVHFPAILLFRLQEDYEDYVGHVSSELDLAHELFWPKLTTLQVVERVPNHFPFTDKFYFTECLPDSLKELHLFDVKAEESLQLFRLLTWDRSDKKNILPRLASLTLGGKYVDKIYLSSITGEALLDMLRSRHEGSEAKWKTHTRLGRLNLRCTRRCSTIDESEKWRCRFAEWQRAGLQELVDEGLELVTTDSEGVEVVWKKSASRSTFIPDVDT
ncbi:hypothetical protein NP233_g220 [Leucocoprinus birnbaumii]|uniref:F-box domain-containing protein n=1 Tax=Leucocoprinus birnbaumii TaxID=56174 RepID=A0AAD5W733_9AGAR|nr:hypothetical protein NP233_g220 [Leucocoprinus birnbaumii]